MVPGTQVALSCLGAFLCVLLCLEYFLLGLCLLGPSSFGSLLRQPPLPDLLTPNLLQPLSYHFVLLWFLYSSCEYLELTTLHSVFQIFLSISLLDVGFPCGSAGKESAFNGEDLGLILELGISPGKGKGYPLQYSGLEKSMDGIVHGVAKSRTQLSDFHFHIDVNFMTATYSIALSFVLFPSAWYIVITP